jgi:hypothetical protein
MAARRRNMSEESIEAANLSVPDTAEWVTKIRANRERGLAARAENADARTRSSVWLNESTALTVDLIRAYGVQVGPRLENLKAVLQQAGIKIPPGGEVPNAIARTVLGGYIDKVRVSRVARAAQELIARGVNDVVSYMSGPGNGLVALSEAWSTRQGSTKEELVPLKVWFSRGAADWLKPRTGASVCMLTPDVAGRLTVVFFGDLEDIQGYVLVRELASTSEAVRGGFRNVSKATAHWRGATFHIVEASDEAYSLFMRGEVVVHHVGSSLESMRAQLPVECWNIQNRTPPVTLPVREQDLETAREPGDLQAG